MNKPNSKKWCGCNDDCEGHTMQVEIDGKIQPHLNALDVLKYALDVKTGRKPEPKDIEK